MVGNPNENTAGSECPFTEKALMQSICSSISEGVLAVDLELRIIFFNPAAERITGVASGEAVGALYPELIREEDCQTLCSIRRTLDTGKPLANHATHLVNRGGERVPVSISTSLVRDAGGEVIGGMAAIRDLRVVEELRRELAGIYTFHDIVGRSSSMRKIFSILPPMARSGATVLIQGESGTGKELVARAIHNESSRSSGPLVTVNCGALPDMLLESELFGYRAGAFTDARKDKPGQVAMAKGGTLFLDEVGEMSAAVQVKLLRLLQEKTFQPLGDVKPVAADVRFIAATNRVLEDAVGEGSFREDLYYRLNVLSLKLPPLRERMGDVSLLIDHMIGRHNRIDGGRIEGISPDALKILMNHSFPGNVRELENVLEHAFALCPEEVIDTAHLPPGLAGATGTGATGTSGASGAAGPAGAASPAPATAEGSLQELESGFIRSALEENGWNRAATAAVLGIHPSTLYRKIRSLGIETPGKDGRSRSGS